MRRLIEILDRRPWMTTCKGRSTGVAFAVRPAFSRAESPRQSRACASQQKHRTGQRFLVLAALVGVSLAACEAVPPSQRSPYLPPGVFGTYQDNDTGAISFSAWAFASPANTRGNPAEAARAMVALEYLPSELTQNPRWIGMDSSIKVHLERSRVEMRRIMGVRPDAPKQLVVNTLLTFLLDLQAYDQPAAMQTLTSPIFTQPAEQTFALLANLPYMQEANLATSRADSRSFTMGGDVR